MHLPMKVGLVLPDLTPSAIHEFVRETVCAQADNLGIDTAGLIRQESSQRYGIGLNIERIPSRRIHCRRYQQH